MLDAGQREAYRRLGYHPRQAAFGLIEALARLERFRAYEAAHDRRDGGGGRRLHRVAPAGVRYASSPKPTKTAASSTPFRRETTALAGNVSSG